MDQQGQGTGVSNQPRSLARKECVRKGGSKVLGNTSTYSVADMLVLTRSQGSSSEVKNLSTSTYRKRIEDPRRQPALGPVGKVVASRA